MSNTTNRTRGVRSGRSGLWRRGVRDRRLRRRRRRVGGGNDSGTEVAKSGPVEGELTISNWPGYMDQGSENTVAEFEDEDRRPGRLRRGRQRQRRLLRQAAAAAGGGQVRRAQHLRRHRLDGEADVRPRLPPGARPLDLPTVFDHLLPSLESPAFDPERKFSVPWQSGLTGMMVNTKLAPDVKSVNDLFDPRYKGKVTMLSEMRDTVPLVMKADGIDPSKATKQQWLATIDKFARRPTPARSVASPATTTTRT